MNYKFQEEQRNGRIKGTLINHSYIDGGEYRKKFDSISDNPKLNKLLYRLSKKMLLHRNGTLYEDMYWIDTETCSVVAEETSQNVIKKIKYSRRTQKNIKKQEGLLTIHSHPNSYPPSIEDFNSNYLNQFGVGIIICHDGKIFLYSSNEYINENYYEILVEKFYRIYHDIYEAQIFALDKVRKKYQIKYREV